MICITILLYYTFIIYFKEKIFNLQIIPRNNGLGWIILTYNGYLTFISLKLEIIPNRC